GPDGVPGRVLALALRHLGSHLRQLFNDCLEAGRFPRVWKQGRLVLLRKEGRSPDSPSAYRPIVLIDEVSKMLERVLASRINQHLALQGPDLSEHQYGFRVGKSTIDAVGALKSFCEGAQKESDGVLAVSLDIANAFGTLPYSVVEEALQYHRVPLYLRRMIGHYLEERVVVYQGKDGARQERRMACGVPQGSVLGPLLWNLGFDWAIRPVLLPRMVIICYADDTMVAVRGSSYEESVRRATVATELMVTRIGMLGLKVALPKTEELSFAAIIIDPGWLMRASSTMRRSQCLSLCSLNPFTKTDAMVRTLSVDAAPYFACSFSFKSFLASVVAVRTTSRFISKFLTIQVVFPQPGTPFTQVILGAFQDFRGSFSSFAILLPCSRILFFKKAASALPTSCVIDSALFFDFSPDMLAIADLNVLMAVLKARVGAEVAPKLIGAAGALSRLLPNLGGPGVGCRRLYTGVVRSMALYGAPIWADALVARNRTLLRRPQRVMAARVIRAYRTISHEAACALAGTPPWDLDAEVLACVHERRVEVRMRGEHPSPERVTGWRRLAQAELFRQWRERLESPSAGLRTIDGIRPVLQQWVERRHGVMTFHLAQVLSGHGCFGKYLCKIAGREPTEECHECGCAVDTAQHTLADCPSWAVQRAALVAVVGQDLSLPAVVRAMAGSELSWDAIVSFCEDVILQKEAAERVREEDPDAHPLRRRRGGRRRRQFAARQLPLGGGG
ncbi:uncharacterized protein LOC120634122, partial [Pararge aegeria]|uniref:uncharacterized protein LOC120634122 n=1 Tax=Pararge aegeria TaxID=116150 RepID=UPI0019D192BE